MFAAIRRYITSAGREQDTIAHGRNGILPLIEREAGFVDYYFIDAGYGELIAVAVFETRQGAEKSNTIASAYIAETPDAAFLKRIDIMDGEIAVHAMNPLVEPRFAAIRRYIAASGHEDELIAHTREGLLPLLQSVQGFAAYYLLYTGDGEMIGMSAFDSEAASDKANLVVSEYVEKNTAHLLRRMQVLQGSVAIHARRPQGGASRR
jgi:hypothetical protein